MHRLFALFGLFVLCFALGVAPLAYAKGDATAQTDAVARPATPSEVNSREGFLPEFPGRYFGMSPEEVVALEGKPESSELDPRGFYWITYKKELNGSPWLLVYLFAKRQLVILGYDYVFYGYQAGQPLPFDKYQRWVVWLESKYGPPLKHYRFWGEEPDAKEFLRTKELECYYWEVVDVRIQLVFYPPQPKKDQPLRNNKPYMSILYYTED